MADKDYNNNNKRKQIRTSSQSSKHRKKQEGTAIAIPSRDAPQRERPFTNPNRTSTNTNANKTTRRRSDFDSDFMENRINKYLNMNNAAASTRKNRPRESESISFDLPSSSSSDIKSSKFVSTKQPAIAPRTVDTAKLLEVIRSQKSESEASGSSGTRKHKVFGNFDLPTNRSRFNPREIDDDEDDEDEVFDKNKSPGSSSYSSSNKAKSTEVIEIDSDEETNPSSVATTEKKSSPFDFLNVGASNAKPTKVTDLPKIALDAPKSQSYMEYINRSNDQAKNKRLSTSMSSSKPKITSSLRGASESSGNASSIKSDRVQRDAASSLQSTRQSNSDITSRKYAEVTTPFTTQLRSKKLGSTTSTTPLCSMPPVNIPDSYKPISTSSVSSSSRSSFIPPLSYRKNSDTSPLSSSSLSSSTSSSSTYKPGRSFASPPSNRIGNSNSVSNPIKNSPTKSPIIAKYTKQQQQKHVINVSDSSSDEESDDEFKSAPTSPVEDDGSDRVSSDAIVKGANTAKRKLVDIEELSDQEDDPKKVKVTPEPKKFNNIFVAKKDNTTNIGTKPSSTISNTISKDKIKSGISDFNSTTSLNEEVQRTLKEKTSKKPVATPIAVPKNSYSPSKESSSSSTLASIIKTAEPSKPPSYLPTGDPSKEILVYPFSGKKASIICNSDVLRLANDRFLNDCIMNIYPVLLQDEIPRDDIHTFSTFFFTRLTEVDESSSTSNGGSSLLRKVIQKSNEPISYENIRRWTDKIDIFDKKHLIVPIAQSHHWFLAVITNPGSCDGTKTDNDNEILIAEGVEESTSSSDCCITFLDSLSFNHDDCYEQLCDYLKEEAINRLNIERSKFKKPKHVKGRAPQQLNNSDCGVHCLQCIKRIFEEPEQIQDALLHPEIANDYLWKSDEIADFRKKLALKLLKKAKEYEAYLKEQKKEDS